MSKLLGLDIGTTTIKLVELDNSGGSHRLVAAAITATPSKGLQSEAVADHAVLAESIKKAVSDAHVSTKSVNIALPENAIYTRVIEMPQLSEKEIASAIRWEAEQYIPLPLSEAILDYQVLNNNVATKKGPMMEIFLVASPITLVEKYKKIVDMAGLQLVSVETSSLALNRALVVDNSNNLTTLVISIGDNTSDIFISKAGNILLTHVIPTAGKALTRALASDLGLDIMQAEEYKKTYGLKEEILSGKIGNTVKPLLENLATEIKRTITFYQSKYIEPEIVGRVVLFGGSAKLPNLVVYLAENLGIETQIGDPWQKVKDTQKLANQPFDPILYAQAVGLALKPL